MGSGPVGRARERHRRAHLSHGLVIDDVAVAAVLLRARPRPGKGYASHAPSSLPQRTRVRQRARPRALSRECAALGTFLMTLSTFLRSSAASMPWTVVMHLRPFRCCTRMWMSADCSSSSPAFSKGSAAPHDETRAQGGVSIGQRKAKPGPARGAAKRVARRRHEPNPPGFARFSRFMRRELDARGEGLLGERSWQQRGCVFKLLSFQRLVSGRENSENASVRRQKSTDGLTASWLRRARSAQVHARVSNGRTIPFPFELVEHALHLLKRAGPADAAQREKEGRGEGGRSNSRLVSCARAGVRPPQRSQRASAQDARTRRFSR